MGWEPESPRSQVELSADPYDRWVSPTGYCQAEFYRDERGYLIRFSSQADFLIERCPSADSGFRVTGWPAPQCDAKTTINLYHNAIQPILGNHSGGLFLHGSAVFASAEDHSGAADGAIAFLGLSRSGKTTLAGSFAQAGHPFLTEDVIDLVNNDGRYWLQPKRSKLRLFADSARHLLGSEMQFDNDDIKQDVEAGAGLPFADAAQPLRQIYVLGSDLRADLSIRQLSLQEALTALLPNAFILDVEDKATLRAHFSRLADLSQDIPCYALDFARDYSELPRVRKAVLENLTRR